MHPSLRGSQISESQSGRGASVSQITAKMEGEDKSVLFGFHRFDPEINCQGLNDTHNINHRLNVIMRAGQVVKRGLQVLVTASYLKVWSQETKCQLEGYLAQVQHRPVSSPSRSWRRPVGYLEDEHGLGATE